VIKFRQYLSILFSASIVFISMHTLIAQSQRENGLIDLSANDFAKTEVALEGTAEFYWNQLLSPDQITSEISPDYFTIPQLWNGAKTQNGVELCGQGYATYRLKLLLPKSQHEYTLHVEDMYSSFVLFVNGDTLYSNGKVAEKRDSYVPNWKPGFVSFTAQGDTTEIVLQIANFDHKKGGISEGITIGLPYKMANRQLEIMVYDLILTGSLMMGGLFFLGLFFFGHYDKAILYFAMFCIVYSYRVIGFGYYVLHQLIDVSWYITIRIEYITLFASTFLFGRFIRHLYPTEVPRLAWRIMSLVCLFFGLIAMIAPVQWFTYLVEPFFVMLVVYLVITLMIYVRAFNKKLVGSQYALISTGVIFVVFLYNIFAYYGWLPHMVIASFIGYVIFFFSQSLILSFRFAYFLKHERDRAEQASKAKSDFLSTISHEIRTPLNGVVGLSHLLLQEDPREDQRENLVSLKFSAEHLTSLINDILDYNKLESGAVELEEMDVNLPELGNRIYRSYLGKALEKQLKLTFHCDPKIASSLLLDSTRMSQILNNLLDNAIKFTKEGEVKLNLTLVSKTEERQEILFEVIDSGIGIPADKLASIFERFTQASSSTTREYGGSGLGLSIIKKLLELQEAKIHVKSEIGVGSTFYFEKSFAIGEGKSQQVQQADEETKGLLRGKYILLVEDNKMNVMVATKFLTRWGVTWEVAENGAVGVEKVMGNTYDLVLMDLQMPVMDGYDASKKIRETDKETPIVALTASALDDVQESVLRVGMNDFITKPFDPKELKRKILKNLRVVES
jgi:signal transduction histidine kinase/ActR/RegA family two-component response regulator